MIVLDTNVVSELMRRAPEPSVVDWVDGHPAEHVFITAVTAAELRYGAARLPDGQRRDQLIVRGAELLTEDFQEQVLPFDDAAAEQYAGIVAGRERAGRPISMADAQIAAICRCYGAPLATRNVEDFSGVGLRVLNPWEADPS
ncbi:type II toxin-antitoxin system VapC family toxin [Amycolatopsis tucumanensis]|uniref:Ribonuclease VapC n=1 Tax=Amycolatopsis tucumanensis TaxID=401106 RepID=A0ABP7HEF3_9PSEU|nr:type II toxin-antitoxin system VapC family toxin [Amycolatopsis tucumanensis]MCF6421449.1 type II toxin-antitoxin system VapC family toxin [Amycolatopsis tucumanensis]